MTKQQLIRLILDAAATGKIEDAEKAIDEYVGDETYPKQLGCRILNNNGEFVSMSMDAKKDFFRNDIKI